nr:ulp1 protease family, C-terminal catalytic domain-containing protein [Tanacetum cinerariifolium]
KLEADVFPTDDGGDTDIGEEAELEDDVDEDYYSVGVPKDLEGRKKYVRALLKKAGELVEIADEVMDKGLENNPTDFGFIELKELGNQLFVVPTYSQQPRNNPDETEEDDPTNFSFHTSVNDGKQFLMTQVYGSPTDMESYKTKNEKNGIIRLNRFQQANKKYTINAEVFKIILDIFQRVEGVDFTDVPDDDTALTFLIDLGYKGPLNKHTNMFVDHMHQPWRTLATIIKNCVSGKTTSNDKLRKSIIDILWGMFNRENVDYPELIWEDIAYQIDHKKEKRLRRRTCRILDSPKSSSTTS